MQHGRVIERDLVSDPGVIGLGWSCAEEDVLDPVGGHPPVASPCSMLTHHGVTPVARISSVNATRSSTRLGDLIAGLLEGRVRVPDDRLESGLVRIP